MRNLTSKGLFVSYCPFLLGKKSLELYKFCNIIFYKRFDPPFINFMENRLFSGWDPQWMNYELFLWKVFWLHSWKKMIFCILLHQNTSQSTFNGSTKTNKSRPHVFSRAWVVKYLCRPPFLLLISVGFQLGHVCWYKILVWSLVRTKLQPACNPRMWRSSHFFSVEAFDLSACVCLSRYV